MSNDEVIERLREYLREYADEKLEHSTKAGRGMFNCPFCGSGTGRNRTGAFSITPDGKHYTCFACGAKGSIFELIGHLENLPTFRGQLKFAANKYGMSHLLEDRSSKYTHTHNSIHMSAYTQKPTSPISFHTRRTKPAPKDETDFTEFFKEAQARIDGPAAVAYLTSRGISLKTARKHGLGFCPDWTPPNNPNAPASPRLILPSSNTSYLARDTRNLEDIPERSKGYIKRKVGTGHIFNIDALKQSEKPVFVTEGEIDALSIIEVGGEAVALGSVSWQESLLSAVEKLSPTAPLILALDNDPPGIDNQSELEGKLKHLKKVTGSQVTFFPVNFMDYFTDEHGEQITNSDGSAPKDQNDALILDRDAFTRAVETLTKQAPTAAAAYVKALQAEIDQEKAAEEQARLAKLDEYNQKYQAYRLLEAFNDEVSRDTPCYPTGFSSLDNELDGGLYSGLYILGAISSLGKTTFALQIADSLAASGYDVLFFSMEMSRNEIIAKSLSRLTYDLTKGTVPDGTDALTTRSILTYARRDSYSSKQNTALGDATRRYSLCAKNLYLIEGVGEYGAKAIKEAVTEHVAVTGKTPVVFVDYLQILTPADPHATDKNNMDNAVLELKRLSRDLKAVVFAISSLNRLNYEAKANMAAFKESGAIEYGADVLLGMQLRGAGKQDFNVDTGKAKDPREIELIVLKNRNGITGGKLGFLYKAKFNHFSEPS